MPPHAKECCEAAIFLKNVANGIARVKQRFTRGEAM